MQKKEVAKIIGEYAECKKEYISKLSEIDKLVCLNVFETEPALVAIDFFMRFMDERYVLTEYHFDTDECIQKGGCYERLPNGTKNKVRILYEDTSASPFLYTDYISAGRNSRRVNAVTKSLLDMPENLLGRNKKMHIYDLCAMITKKESLSESRLDVERITDSVISEVLTECIEDFLRCVTKLATAIKDGYAKWHISEEEIYKKKKECERLKKELISLSNEIVLDNNKKSIVINLLSSYIDGCFDDIIFVADSDTLPQCACVYVVIDMSFDVIYVGQTGDLRQRFWSHFKERFDRKEVLCIGAIYELERNARLKIEMELIQNLNPKLNKKTCVSTMCASQPCFL